MATRRKKRSSSRVRRLGVQIVQAPLAQLPEGPGGRCPLGGGPVVTSQGGTVCRQRLQHCATSSVRRGCRIVQTLSGLSGAGFFRRCLENLTEGWP